MAGYPVLGIANEFLRLASETGRNLTPMHLQKLCYMAHGFDLALFDKPLTADRIEAWAFGPVYPALYDALKSYGSRPVTELICQNNWAMAANVKGDVVTAQTTPHESRLLDKVWKDYGAFDAFQLSALTHEADSPWAKVYVAGTKNIVIPNEYIKNYFLELVEPKQ